MLEIDILRNSSQNILGVLRGAFSGFWCPKRQPDTLLATTMSLKLPELSPGGEIYSIWWMLESPSRSPLAGCCPASGGGAAIKVLVQKSRLTQSGNELVLEVTGPSSLPQARLHVVSLATIEDNSSTWLYRSHRRYYIRHARGEMLNAFFY